MPRNMNLHFVEFNGSMGIFYIEERQVHFNNDGKVLHDFIETAVAANGERKYGKHPTQKPVQLMGASLKY